VRASAGGEAMSDDKIRMFRIAPGESIHVETPAMRARRMRLERLRRGILIASYITLGLCLASLTLGIVGLAIGTRLTGTNVLTITSGGFFGVINALRIRRLRRERRYAGQRSISLAVEGVDSPLVSAVDTMRRDIEKVRR
jgi:hypothetical protein